MKKISIIVPCYNEEETISYFYDEVTKYLDSNYEWKIILVNDGSKDKTGSLCAVGDVDQSIYSWRGADFKIILNFQKDYENTKLIKLEQNYRSTKNIISGANKLIKNNSARIDKTLFTENAEGDNTSAIKVLFSMITFFKFSSLKLKSPFNSS